MSILVVVVFAGYQWFWAGEGTDTDPSPPLMEANPEIVVEASQADNVPTGDVQGDAAFVGGPRPAWGRRQGVFDGGSIDDLARRKLMYGQTPAMQYVAVGERDGKAAAWWSSYPLVWSVVDVELPPATPSAIRTAAAFGGRWVAVGEAADEIALWVSRSALSWEFVGPVMAMAGVDTVVDMAASEEAMLLVGDSPSGVSLFGSSDGEEWDELDPGLSGQTIVREVIAVESHFVVVGSSCIEEACRPTVWTTTTGSDWVVASGFAGETSDLEGMVTSVAASDGLVVAAGWTASDGTIEPAVWLSRDGSSWRSAHPSGAFDVPAISIVLDTIAAGPPRMATLRIDGSRVTMGVRTSAATPVGVLEITDIADDSVTFIVAGRTVTLTPGGTTTVALHQQVLDVDVQGDRVMAVGLEEARWGEPTGALAWTSTDGGATWQRVALPGESDAFARFAVLHLKRLVALSDGTAGEAWESIWDTEPDVARAVAVLQSFVDAARHGRVDDVARTVRTVVSGDETPPLLRLPGAEPFAARFWTGDGVFDPNAVVALSHALAKTGSEVAIGECEGEMAWDPESVHLTCGYTARSHVLSLLGADSETGVIRATVRGDAVEDIQVDGDALFVWRSLEAFVRTQEPHTGAAIFGEVAGSAATQQLTVAEAATVLEWAAHYAASVLRPGGSMTTIGPWGTIEWTFSEPQGDLFFHSVTSVGGGFIGLAEVPGEFDGPTTWVSGDGLTWTEAASTAGPLWWGDPIRVGADVVFMGSSGPDERQTPWVWNGSSWREIGIEPAPQAGWWWPAAAASGDRILLFGQSDAWFTTGSQAERGIWSGTIDTGLKRISAVGPDLSGESPILIGRSDGFVLIDRVGGTAGAVWESTDGVEWRLLTDDPGIEGEWIEQVHDIDGVFTALVQEAFECNETAENEWYAECRRPTAIWSSNDGVEWTRLLNGPRDIRRLFAGPSGGVAVGWPEGWYAEEERPPEPMAVYIASGDGRWSAVKGLVVATAPGDRWRWVSGAVDEGRIVITVNADPWSGERTSSVLVGRFIDGG